MLDDSESADVAEVAVFSVPDPRWGERVLAAVVPCDGAGPEEARAVFLSAAPT